LRKAKGKISHIVHTLNDLVEIFNRKETTKTYFSHLTYLKWGCLGQQSQARQTAVEDTEAAINNPNTMKTNEIQKEKTNEGNTKLSLAQNQKQRYCTFIIFHPFHFINIINIL